MTKIYASPECGLNEGSHSEILRIRIFVSEEYFKFGGVGVVLPHPTLISFTNHTIAYLLYGFDIRRDSQSFHGVRILNKNLKRIN